MTDYEDDDTNPPSDRRTYRNYLLRAKGVQDWSDIEAVNGIHVGLTQEKWDWAPVVMIAGSRINTQTVDMERFLMYVIYRLDTIVDKKYILVYSHFEATAANQPSFDFLKHVHKVLDKRYRKNVLKVFILDPGFFIKSTFRMLKPFLSEKFWKKLNYVDNKDTLCLALEMKPSEFGFFGTSAPVRFLQTAAGHSMPSGAQDAAATKCQKVVRGWLDRRYVGQVRKATAEEDHIQHILSCKITLQGHYIDWSVHDEKRFIAELSHETGVPNAAITVTSAKSGNDSLHTTGGSITLEARLQPSVGLVDQATDCLGSIKRKVESGSEILLANRKILVLGGVGERMQSGLCPRSGGLATPRGR